MSDFLAKLQALCPYSIQLRLHSGRSTYIRARLSRNELHLSLHRLFLDAPSPVLEAVIRFAMRKDRKARAIVRQMAHLYFSRLVPEPDPSLSNPKGDFANLQDIYDRLNKTYFDNQIQAPITWFEARYRRFRHITFGSYDRTRPLIRINRLLDQADAPTGFLEFVVYHEMLHAVCPPEIDRLGRIRIHTAEFRRREKLHPHYPASRTWGKELFIALRSEKKNGRITGWAG